ncbi:unnamed protein product [Fusarium graminearum]|nr:unnamed protein product [Fusarium graminearum]
MENHFVLELTHLLGIYFTLYSIQIFYIDAFHIDRKKHGVLDIKNTMMRLACFLPRKELKEDLASLFY